MAFTESQCYGFLPGIYSYHIVSLRTVVLYHLGHFYHMISNQADIPPESGSQGNRARITPESNLSLEKDKGGSEDGGRWVDLGYIL